jgi:hypothetical protein
MFENGTCIMMMMMMLMMVMMLLMGMVSQRRVK